ncbi:hypothetical protein [Nannocystis punicea]|uniref:Uncharacterized protein n=1 Tax=Nannocystis punicea TaxID=2995304 RepID=A0ABY7H8E1_9BACT|nr:hypothetical protein [Nannocystis poenicansa]WAS95532.1 hypothetical protein O0S08_05165 [Nannocystis poenicansa]
MLRIAAAGLVFTIACLSGGCPQPDSPGATSGVGEPVVAESACECVEPEAFAEESASCFDQRPCDLVERACLAGDEQGDAVCGEWGEFHVSEAALNCALEQMIAGSPGLIFYEDTAPRDDGDALEFPHEFAWGGFIQVMQSRTALGRDWTSISNLDGESKEESAAEVHDLKARAYFEGCKAEPDLSRRFDCLIAWRAGDARLTCDAPSVVHYEMSSGL